VAVLDDFAAARPEAVLRHGNEWLVAAEAAPDLVAEANRRGVKVLGLEGFLIDGDATYPALTRIADFSGDPPEVANRRALALLAGDWSSPPTSLDQMSSVASGRHMIAVVLDE
jgi:hypothetical protein